MKEDSDDLNPALIRHCDNCGKPVIKPLHYFPNIVYCDYDCFFEDEIIGQLIIDKLNLED